MVDQYVGLRASERYTLGNRAKIKYVPPSVPLTDIDVLSYVHAVASATGGSGYGHIFHVFLPPGQDECFDSTFTVCYSPDNSNTFFFCAYHGSVDFTDIGHVLYSVEPYQNVPGCQVRPGTPNGQLVDSTNDVLSHELFETITDPDGDAWWNSTGLGLEGQEIGDECIFLVFTSTNVYSDPFIFKIGDDVYATQPEYSNALTVARFIDRDCWGWRGPCPSWESEGMGPHKLSHRWHWRPRRESLRTSISEVIGKPSWFLLRLTSIFNAVSALACFATHLKLPVFPPRGDG